MYVQHSTCCPQSAWRAPTAALAADNMLYESPRLHAYAPQICEASISRARRVASVLGVHGQPEDHPFPAACPELRYLKFVAHGLD